MDTTPMHPAVRVALMALAPLSRWAAWWLMLCFGLIAFVAATRGRWWLLAGCLVAIGLLRWWRAALRAWERAV